jgi:hypothetical protein
MKTFEAVRRSLVIGLTLAVTATFLGGQARAAMISFTLDAQGGNSRISYGGGVLPLEGKNLGVVSLKGIGTSAHAGETIGVEKGSFTFATGPSVDTNKSGPLTMWNFGSGGSLTLTGGVPSLNIPDGTPLLTGTFNGVSKVVPLDANADLKMEGGAFVNVVDSRLAAYLGMPTKGVQYTGGVSTYFAAPGCAPGAILSTVFSSGTLTTQPVPEPGTLAVFTLALGGAFAWHRRRLGV